MHPAIAEQHQKSDGNADARTPSARGSKRANEQRLRLELREAHWLAKMKSAPENAEAVKPLEINTTTEIDRSPALTEST